MKTTRIRQTHIIPAPPHKVYEALTNPKLHAAFTGAKATGVPKVGGKFSAWQGYISAKYLILIKNKIIVQEWKTSTWPKNAPPSRLELSLTPHPLGTQLLMLHFDVPASEAPHFRLGWVTHYWSLLKTYFAPKPPAPKKTATKSAKKSKRK